MLNKKFLCAFAFLFFSPSFIFSKLSYQNLDFYGQEISEQYFDQENFSGVDKILSKIFLEQEDAEIQDSLNSSKLSREKEAADFIQNKDIIYIERRKKLMQNEKNDDITSQNFAVDQNNCFKPINAVVLDAGHGGSDYGSIRHGVVEKNLTLILVKKIHSLLAQSNPNLKLYATRNKDQFISLKTRVSKTANWSLNDTILFVSVHGNSAHNIRAHGLEIYTLSNKASDTHALATERLENSGFTTKDIKKTDAIFSVLSDLVRDNTQKQSLWLARYVYDSAIYSCKTMGRGLRQARFFVLNYNVVPSILIEVGFLSNSKEAKKLQSAEYQNKLAKGITRGLLYYISDYNKTEGFTK